MTMRLWPIVLFVCVSCAAVRAADLEEPSEKVKKHLGADVVKLIRSANKVEAYRVGNVDYEKAGTNETLGGRLLNEGGGKTMSAEFAAKSKAALLADDTYFKADSKGTCVGVAFRLTSPDGAIVEFSCCVQKGNVWLVAKDASGKVVKKGDMRGFREDKNSPIRKLCVEAFADDADVQKYKPKE